MIGSFAENEQDVFNSLSDDLSKRIFMLRRGVARSETVSFADVFMGRETKSVDSLIKLLTDKKYICCGAGDGCRQFLSIMRHNDLLSNCISVFDGSITLHGTKIEGMEVAAYADDVLGKADLVINTAYSYSISDSIGCMLINLGVDSCKILPFCDYFALDDVNMYFDKVVLDCLIDGEIFIDGGCLDFSTSLSFLKKCPNVRKIYAIEPNIAQIPVIRQKISESGFLEVEIVCGALWSEETKLTFSVHETKSASAIVNGCCCNAIKVPAYAIDDIVKPNDRITFIKLDIEGSELEALNGANKTIKRFMPKLAVSVYHKPMDYVDLPRYIKSIAPEYKMYLRHYTSYSSETVLYCVA